MEEIDKGEISEENLIWIHADLGLKLIYDKPASEKISTLSNRYGDIRNELLYLQQQEEFTIDDTVEHVALRGEGREHGRNIADKAYNEKFSPRKILSSDWIPDYLSDPEISEEYNSAVDSLDQLPAEEPASRIIEALSENSLKPSEIEKEVSDEVKFEAKSWIRYLETQEIVERYEDGSYGLNVNNISEEFLGEKIILDGELKDQERYGKDPWKP